MIQKRKIVDSLQVYENSWRVIATAQVLEEMELQDYKQIVSRIFNVGFLKP
jgi:hypothetical protein